MKNFVEPACKMGMYFDNIETLVINTVTVIGAKGDEIIANNIKNIVK
jgi:hypothetical protein